MNLKLNDRNPRGFSLIELMIAIAIISVLAAISIPSYKTYLQRATFANALSVLQPYTTQVVEYLDTHGGLDQVINNNGGCPLNLIQPSYVSDGPVYGVGNGADCSIAAFYYQTDGTIYRIDLYVNTACTSNVCYFTYPAGGYTWTCKSDDPSLPSSCAAE